MPSQLAGVLIDDRAVAFITVLDERSLSSLASPRLRFLIGSRHKSPHLEQIKGAEDRRRAGALPPDWLEHCKAGVIGDVTRITSPKCRAAPKSEETCANPVHHQDGDEPRRNGKCIHDEIA